MANTRKRVPWNQLDIEKLKEFFYSGHSLASIAKSLGRGYRSVNWKLHELGLCPGRLHGITQWDIDMARALRAEGVKVRTIAEKLELKFSTVQYILYRKK